VVIAAHQFELAEQAHQPLVAMCDELGVAAAVLAHAASPNTVQLI
jgi:hypothetical protein